MEVLVRVLGAAMLIGTGLLLTGAVGVAAYAIVRGDGHLLRRAALGAGGWLLAYGLIWGTWVLAAPRRRLGPGQELSFCGLDCHLHLSALSSRRDSGVVVQVRLRSDARGAPEFPGLLRMRLVDGRGTSYAPVGGSLGGPLQAGATVSRELRFAMPRSAEPKALVASWGGVLDYLVIGPENALVQQRTALALGSGPR